MGLSSGRKAVQRPMKDGAALLRAVQDVYLDKSVTVAGPSRASQILRAPGFSPGMLSREQAGRVARAARP